ncbi:MAG: cyclic nucleotide-binding domain-containing protein [Desulfobacteraceae bacterium]|jgi:NTE family protein
MKPHHESDLYHFLETVPLFSSIPDAQLRVIAGHCERVHLPKGETVFEEGGPGDAMYIIKSGAVGVYSIVEGAEVFVATLHRGDFFGEMALLTGNLRTASIRVLLDVQLYRLAKEGFDRLLRANPDVALYLSRLYARRFAETSKMVLHEPPPALFSMVATHQGLGKTPFLYSLAYHLTTESQKRVLVVELDGTLFETGRTCSLHRVDCRVPEILQTFSGRFREEIEKAWYEHESGFGVFVLPTHQPRGFWQELDESVAFFMDLVRIHYDCALFNVPSPLSPLGKRVLRLCDRALFLMNNQEAEFVRVRAVLAEVVHRFDGRADRVRAGVSHLVGGPGIARRALAKRLDLPEPPGVWVPRSPEALAGRMDTEKRFPVRGAQALARELGGVRVGLVLGAGGARGWAHLGVIKVLEEEGIPIDLIVGSSIGSMVGCLYAYSASIEETAELVRTTLPTKFQAQHRLFDYTIPLRGIIRGGKIKRMTREAVNNADFLDLKIPAYVVAVDYHAGERVVIDSGDVSEAVRSSISIPGIMSSPLHQGRRLLDGGLIAPVPVDVAVQRGADIILAVCVERGKSRIYQEGGKPPSIMRVMSRTMNIIHAHATRGFAQMADVVLYPDVEAFAWDAFHKVPELMRAGEDACREQIEEIRALVSEKEGRSHKN